MRQLATLLFVAVFGLGGCATTRIAPSPDQQAPAANEGIVVVSVTGNTSQVNQFDSIRLEREHEAESGMYILKQVSRGVSRDTAVFVGVLPQGEYEFQRFSDADSQKFLRLTERNREVLGPFRVRPGAVADLGRLVVTPVNFGILAGRSEHVRSNREVVTGFLPEFARYYRGDVNGGWVNPHAKSDVAERYAQTHPVGATAFVETKRGEVIAASRMGTVLIRNRAGRWYRVGTGTLESLLGVMPGYQRDSLLYAVGEFNTFVRMDRKGRFHRVDTGDLPPGNLLFLDGNASAGWFVAHQGGGDVTIFRTPSLSKPRWESVRRNEVGSSFWRGKDKFFIWRTSRGFAYAFSSGDIHLYDSAKHTWEQRRLPTNDTLANVIISPGDVWGVLMSGLGGVFSDAYYSRDFGRTWTETNSPFKVKAQPPVVTPKGTLLQAGGFLDAGLQASRDGGKTWNGLAEKGELPVGTLWVMPTAGLFVVGGPFGIEQIRRSADDGATWTLEFTTFEERLN